MIMASARASFCIAVSFAAETEHWVCVFVYEMVKCDWECAWESGQYTAPLLTDDLGQVLNFSMLRFSHF